MAVTLILVGKTPGQSQFSLDQFTEHYKCDATADVVLTDASVPQRGDVHPNYPFMFVTDRHCAETAQSASALDLVYGGCLASSGGAPVLPPQQHEFGDAVQSASSSWGSAGASIGTVSAQFYAPQNILSYISYNAVGTVEADDPTGDIEIITVTAGSGTFAPGTTIATLATSYFSSQIVHSMRSTEVVVATKFWQNVSTKTKVLVPFIITIPAGTALIGIGAPGSGYAVGNTLTISAGGESATIVVASLGVSQSILQITTTSNTFTTAHSLLVPSGGSGSGALFNVIIV